MLRRPQIVLGIDPGLHGAFVVYDATNNSVINARIVPTLVLKRNGKQRLTLDIPSLVGMTNSFAAQHTQLVAFLELVGAHRIHGRAQGGSSMFSFGKTSGSIETAVIAAGIPYSMVPPARWKAALGCTQDKDQTLDRATQLMPSAKGVWSPSRGVRTKEDCKGIAEAALIAYWGAHHSPPKPWHFEPEQVAA